MNVITGYCFVSKSYVRITMNEAEIDAGWNFFEDSVSAIKYFEEHKWRSDAKYGIMTVYKELWEITKKLFKELYL